MRIALAILLLALSSPLAHADDDAPVAQPMQPAASADEVCAAVRGDMDAKLPCKKIGSTKLDGATLEGYAVTDPDNIAHFAVVMVVHEESFVSSFVQVELQDCAMMKCLLVDKTAPKLHAARSGALGVLEVAVTEHWRHTNPDNGKTSSDRPRHNLYVIACSKTDQGPPTCTVRQDGDMSQRSCTGSVDADGNLVTTCQETEAL